MELIADRVGITAPAVFRRVGSKQQLMVQALTTGFGQSFVEVLRAGPHVDSPVGEQVAEIVGMLRQDIEALLPCLSTLRAAGLEVADLAAAFDEAPPALAQRELAAWIRRGQALGLFREQDADAAAISCMGAVHMRVFFTRILGLQLPGADEHVDHVSEFVERALVK
ncbi:TetR/AcrR family transcriptional regulator C-terminal domain-containing protein [Myxococcota bacterium]|nr:TetR/AcrR family transcriptional regulator C-terminal domain-containing protein [Myxococcota bacterium]